VGLYRGGPAWDCTPVHLKSQIYTDPSREEVVTISSVRGSQTVGNTHVIRFKGDFFERCFVVACKKSDTFSAHDIEHFARLITRCRGLPSGYVGLIRANEFQVVSGPGDVENGIVMTIHSDAFGCEACWCRGRSIEQPYVAELVADCSYRVCYD